MKKPRISFATGVPEEAHSPLTKFQSARRRPFIPVLAVLSLTVLLASPLPAQPARSLTLPPSITIVGTNDQKCQDTLAELQRLIREFAFVRGHRIYLVCDRAAWHASMHQLTRAYGVIVASRGAVSDIKLRETWFFAEALRKGAEGHKGDYVYAHELGHFVCSCVEEDAADKAAAQLLDDARRNRFTATMQAAPQNKNP